MLLSTGMSITLHCLMCIFPLSHVKLVGLLFIMVTADSHVALLVFKYVITTNLMLIYTAGQSLHLAF